MYRLLNYSRCRRCIGLQQINHMHAMAAYYSQLIGLCVDYIARACRPVTTQPQCTRTKVPPTMLTAHCRPPRQADRPACSSSPANECYQRSGDAFTCRVTYFAVTYRRPSQPGWLRDSDRLHLVDTTRHFTGVAVGSSRVMWRNMTSLVTAWWRCF